MKIIAYGNRERGDDAAGLLVADRLRRRGVDARYATSLFDIWEAGDDVVLVDAMCSGKSPGTVMVWEDAPIHELRQFRTSTHEFSLADLIPLARALNRSPSRLRVYGIEGIRFDIGSDPSPEVAKAVEDLAVKLAEEAATA